MYTNTHWHANALVTYHTLTEIYINVETRSAEIRNYDQELSLLPKCSKNSGTHWYIDNPTDPESITSNAQTSTDTDSPTDTFTHACTGVTVTKNRDEYRTMQTNTSVKASGQHHRHLSPSQRGSCGNTEALSYLAPSLDPGFPCCELLLVTTHPLS